MQHHVFSKKNWAERTSFLKIQMALGGNIKTLFKVPLMILILH